MSSPAVHFEAVLLPAGSASRVLASWRPSVVPLLMSGEPDTSAPPLGVFFIGGPERAGVFEPFSGSLHFLAWPEPSCLAFVPGARFAFLEGTAAVGTGTVVAVVNENGA